ncbi:MAG: NAD(P)H-dependent flavin oxidoreductase YrpB (nitropropane dioxygenase family), partial [Myxococcota bacterium]
MSEHIKEHEEAEGIMKTKLCRDLGLEAPIFAFARAREVVVEVTNAGGMGVLGAISYSAEELDEHLAWIEERVDGRPYGVDTVMPMKYEGRGEDVSKDSLDGMIPPQHKEFVAGLLRLHGVPELPKEQMEHDALLGWSLEAGLGHIEVALRYPNCKLIANALGTPPPEAMDQVHEAGRLMAALCGKPKQALRHKAAGVDIIVGQGWEAGGHTGEIAGMILCPEIVDAVGDTPVLMAGGIGSGRQMAAALALGAEGVWTGSIWLTTEEHLAHNSEALTELYLEATSADT